MGSKGLAQEGDQWNETAKLYKAMTWDFSKPCIMQMLKRVDTLLPFSQASGILDNGCGPGPIITRIIEEYGSAIPKDAIFTASDFSPGMVEEIKAAQLDKKGDPIWDKLEIKQLNAMDMQGVPDSGFSHVTAGLVYFMLPEPNKAMSESHRILKPGGVLAVSSWEGSQWMDVMRAMQPLRPGREFPDWSEDWKNCAGLEDQFKRAGFTDVGAQKFPVYMYTENPKSIAVDMLMKLPPVQSFMQDFSEEETAKATEMMIDQTKEFLSQTPGKLTGTALIGWGRK